MGPIDNFSLVTGSGVAKPKRSKLSIRYVLGRDNKPAALAIRVERSISSRSGCRSPIPVNRTAVADNVLGCVCVSVCASDCV